MENVDTLKNEVALKLSEINNLVGVVKSRAHRLANQKMGGYKGCLEDLQHMIDALKELT